MELEPMRAIGVALDQATLQETAYELGIKKRVTTMTRAQKTELLYYQTMKSTAEAQNYFARTLAKVGQNADGTAKLILNPATALSLLKQQFSQLGRAIGNIFIPILTAMIPYIMAATQVLMDLANAIASAFGFEISDYKFNTSVDNVTGGIDGIGDSADATAKKVKGMLAPFDELNTIDFGDSGSGSGSAGIGGGSLGIDLPEYDWTKNKDLTDRVEEIKKKFEALLPIIGQIAAGILTWKVGSSVINFLDQIIDLDKKGALKKLFGFILLLDGIWGQFNGIKKMIEGDLSSETLGKFFIDTGMTALGTFLLTGRWELAAGVALISFTIAWSLGLKENFQNWLSKKIEKIFPTGISFKWEDGIPKVEINPIMLITFALQWGSKNKNEEEAKGIGESIVGGVTGQLTESALTTTLGPAVGTLVYYMLSWTKNLLGIHSPSTVMRDEVGKNIVDGIIEGILLKLADIVEKIPIVGESIATAIRGGVSASEQDISNTISYTSEEALKKANPWVQTKSEELGRNSITSYNSGFSGETETTTQNIRETIEKGLKNNETNLDETSTNLGRKNIKAYQGGFSEKESETKTTVRKTLNNSLTGSEANLKETSRRLGDTLNTKVGSGFTGNQTNLNSDFKTTMDNALTNGEKDLNRSAKTFGTNLGDEAKTGFESGFDLFGIKIKTPKLEWGFSEASGWKASVLSALGLPTQIPKLKISWYADGGFPEVGDLFIANESGPEWISTMGGKSAVANQDQMTTGIREAAYLGVSQALRENPQSHKTEVNIGNRRVYEGYGSYQTRQANKYGVSTVTV